VAPRLSGPSSVEVRVKPTSSGLVDNIRNAVKKFMLQDEKIYLPSVVTGWEKEPQLNKHVDLIKITESSELPDLQNPASP
jgi:hypothetical protein